MKKRSVMILFPGLTHSGRQYDYGDIETNPDDFLLSAASRKDKMFHRDSNKDVRICKFADADDRVPETDVELDDSPPDGLDEMPKPELNLLASGLGYMKKHAYELEKPKLIKLIRFLRRL
jgi:hypothetical protein